MRNEGCAERYQRTRSSRGMLGAQYVYCPSKSHYCYKNVNVNVSVYSLKSPLSSADFTIYAPRIGTFLYSLISSGENSAFVQFDAAIANHYNLAFSFHQVPITAGWTEEGVI